MRRKPIIPPSIRAAVPRFPWAARSLGYLGQIHPLVAKNYGIDGEIYCAELDLTDAFAPAAAGPPPIILLPKYPGVSRDLAIVCDENITVAQAEAVISAAGGKAAAVREAL